MSIIVGERYILLTEQTFLVGISDPYIATDLVVLAADVSIDVEAIWGSVFGCWSPASRHRLVGSVYMEPALRRIPWPWEREEPVE